MSVFEGAEPLRFGPFVVTVSPCMFPEGVTVEMSSRVSCAVPVSSEALVSGGASFVSDEVAPSMLVAMREQVVGLLAEIDRLVDRGARPDLSERSKVADVVDVAVFERICEEHGLLPWQRAVMLQMLRGEYVAAPKRAGKSAVASAVREYGRLKGETISGVIIDEVHHHRSSPPDDPVCEMCGFSDAEMVESPGSPVCVDCSHEDEW